MDGEYIKTKTIQLSGDSSIPTPSAEPDYEAIAYNYLVGAYGVQTYGELLRRLRNNPAALAAFLNGSEYWRVGDKIVEALNPTQWQLVMVAHEKQLAAANDALAEKSERIAELRNSLKIATDIATDDGDKIALSAANERIAQLEGEVDKWIKAFRLATGHTETPQEEANGKAAK